MMYEILKLVQFLNIFLSLKTNYDLRLQLDNPYL